MPIADQLTNEPEPEVHSTSGGQLATIAGQLQHIADQLSGPIEAHTAVQIQANLQTEIARITALSAGQAPAPLAEPADWPPPPDPTLAKFNEELADLNSFIQDLKTQIDRLEQIFGKIHTVPEANAMPGENPRMEPGA